MNRTQIISTVLGRSGRQGGNQWLLDQAEIELDLIQERLEGGAFMPWFLLAGESSLTTTANQRTVAIPADFLREYEDFPLYRYDASASDAYKKLIKEDFDYLESKYETTGSGEPSEYALVGSEIHLFPTPDAEYTLRWNYYKKGAALSDGVLTNVWTDNASDLLIAELGVVMTGHYILNPIRHERFIADQLLAFNRLLAFDEARKQASKDAQRGEPT